MLRIGLYFLFTFLISHGSSQGTDMGDCACVCGLQSSGGLIGTGSATTSGSFLDRVRGPKGDLGRPGKPGPVGAPGLTGERGPSGPPGLATGGGGEGTSAQSCLEYRGSGVTQSGIYTIKPTPTSAKIEVYCDMTAAGGGWTLVASVHENNMNGKCTVGDNWSSDQGPVGNNTGSSNWENFNVFGSVESATSDDYKSPAYFNLPASDVMLWHVPNNLESSQWSDQASLKYYTENRFLANYGGSLQSMFSKYYPMKTVLTEGSSSATYQGVQSITLALNNSAAEVRSTIPNFYSYNYDFSGVQNHISDGGGDMFDTGNKVYYKIGSQNYNQITYRETYKDLTHGIEVSSATERPFVMLMWVGNGARQVPTFDIKVVSGTGADGSGSYTTYTGDVSSNGFRLSYKAYSVYNANDPSICEVFFYISSTTIWNSVAPTSFTSTRWSSGTDNLEHIMRASGSPRSILMGYTLLSREDDYQVTDSHVRGALVRMLQTISQFRDVERYNCTRTAESLVVPVSYALGSSNDVMAKIPPSVTDQVTPGFIQFRSLSPIGTPNAICPGVKTEACQPSYVCLGGINTYPLTPKMCGDFTGWAGNPEDTPTDTSPHGYAHSLNDISSSILVFTREVTGNVQREP